ncbi:GD10482 [Drosophila simulans]|uniref:GD10482 n=1 Tax=Drosophila simulans TaxID=7240 RepID=B4QEA5_DROSI|nr:GD10482 [Drosophila simulans]
MLQHPATDFYDLAAANAAAVLTARHTPPYSPTGLSGSVALHNNNNSSTSNNNNSTLDIMAHNGGGAGSGLHLTSGSNGGGGVVSSGGSGGRENLPSFGFTQEQVACVCEVTTNYM